MTHPVPPASRPDRAPTPRRRAARILFAALLGISALVALTPAAPVLAQETLPKALELDPEGRAILRAEIRKYLLEHPEVIMEAVQVLEERRKTAEATEARDLVADNAKAIFEDGYSQVAGNPDGDVTVVEFLDYNCGYCKKAHADVRRLVETDAGLRYVVKEFPILGPSSVTAAKAALASRAQQGGQLYMAFNEALMANRGALTDDRIWAIADEVGLDVAALKTEAGKPETQALIDRTYALAKTLEIQGTPTFVVGDDLVRGYVPLDALREAVKAARERQG